MKELYERAKAALLFNKEQKKVKIYVKALGREFILHCLSMAEMAELYSEKEGYAKWLKRVVYAAIPGLSELAVKLVKEGEIKEFCDAADIFSEDDKERIYEALLENAEEESGFEIRGELKN